MAQHQDATLRRIHEIARTEIPAIALEYTKAYRDIDLGDRDQSQIVMAGHQPSLFHPGVWFKNFALSHVAELTSSIAINLVVDNDLVNLPQILYPQLTNNQFREVT